jgi:hypothetical protein
MEDTDEGRARKLDEKKIPVQGMRNIGTPCWRLICTTNPPTFPVPELLLVLSQMKANASFNSSLWYSSIAQTTALRLEAASLCLPKSMRLIRACVD